MVHAGLTLGPHRLIDVIGEGPLGVVWRAEDVRAGRRVAIKLLKADFVRSEASQAAQRRLIAGLPTIQKLDHPQIVRVFAPVMRPEYEALGYSTELVEGQTFDRISLPAAALTGSDSKSLAVILRWFEDLGEILVWLHVRGIVHGNLKPTNLALRSNGSGHDVVLLDLAWSALGQVVPPPGVKSYLSPEQRAGVVPGDTADQWAMAAMLASVLSGGGETLTLGTMPAVLVMAVQRAMQRDPSRRFPRTTEFVDHIRAIRKELERTSSVHRAIAAPWDDATEISAQEAEHAAAGLEGGTGGLVVQRGVTQPPAAIAQAGIRASASNPGLTSGLLSRAASPAEALFTPRGTVDRAVTIKTIAPVFAEDLEIAEPVRTPSAAPPADDPDAKSPSRAIALRSSSPDLTLKSDALEPPESSLLQLFSEPAVPIAPNPEDTVKTPALSPGMYDEDFSEAKISLAVVEPKSEPLLTFSQISLPEEHEMHRAAVRQTVRPKKFTRWIMASSLLGLILLSLIVLFEAGHLSRPEALNEPTDRPDDPPHASRGPSAGSAPQAPDTPLQRQPSADEHGPSAGRNEPPTAKNEPPLEENEPAPNAVDPRKTKSPEEARPKSLPANDLASEARSDAKRSGAGRPDSLRPGTGAQASEARSDAKRSGAGRPDSLRPGTGAQASEARSDAKRSGAGRPDSLRPGTGAQASEARSDASLEELERQADLALERLSGTSPEPSPSRDESTPGELATACDEGDGVACLRHAANSMAKGERSAVLSAFERACELGREQGCLQAGRMWLSSGPGHEAKAQPLFERACQLASAEGCSLAKKAPEQASDRGVAPSGQGRSDDAELSPEFRKVEDPPEASDIKVEAPGPAAKTSTTS